MKTTFIFSLICVAAVALTACEEYPYGYNGYGYGSPYGGYRYGSGGYPYPYNGYGYCGGCRPPHGGRRRPCGGALPSAPRCTVGPRRRRSHAPGARGRDPRQPQSTRY